MAFRRRRRGALPRRWVISGLLALLALLLWLAWPPAAPRTSAPSGGKPVSRSRSLLGPAGRPLFEDFSRMPPQGPPARMVPRPPLARRAAPGRRGGGIALIIDDVGYDLQMARALLALPFPLTVSVLPQAPHAARAAREARRAGRTVMLHLPMEPENPALRERLDSSFLRTGMDDATLRARFERDLSMVPFVAGINNHMGSLLTADRHAMRLVMALCRAHHLFFVDSRTTAASVAAEEARRAGLRWAERQVFLDHVDDDGAIAAAWRHALDIARRRGSCLVIGHPRRRTLAFLRRLGDGEIRLLRPLTALLHR